MFGQVVPPFRLGAIVSAFPLVARDDPPAATVLPIVEFARTLTHIGIKRCLLAQGLGLSAREACYFIASSICVYRVSSSRARISHGPAGSLPVEAASSVRSIR
jgi:hypothetical protein